MKITFFWSGIFLGMFFIGNAFACSCVRGRLEDRAKNASEIFIGKALNTITLEKDSPLTRERTTFQIYKSWKSKNIDTIAIETDDAPCAYGFIPNTEYLVFAYKNEKGSLTTAACEGTGKLEWKRTKEEIERLETDIFNK